MILLYLIIHWASILQIDSLSALKVLFAFLDLILMTLNVITADFLWKALETQ